MMRSVVVGALLVACKSREPAPQPSAATPPAAPAPAPFAVASIPTWRTTDAGSGDVVDVIAVDAVARPVLFALAPDNMVLVGGDQRITGRIQAPRTAAFAAVATAAGLETAVQGTMSYVLPKAAALPEAPKLSARDVFDLDTDDATLAQVTIALRKLGFPLGLCSDTRVTVTLHGAPAAEVARALQVLSGATLTQTATCETTEADVSAFDTREQLRVLAATGKKHAAVLESNGHDVFVTDSTMYLRGWLPAAVLFEPSKVRAMHVEVAGIFNLESWLESVRRVAAFVRAGNHVKAWFDTGDRTIPFDSESDAPDLPKGMVPVFDDQGAHFDRALVPLKPR